jgi:hypothetical protein
MPGGYVVRDASGPGPSSGEVWSRGRGPEVGKRSPDECDHTKTPYVCDEFWAGLAPSAATLRYRCNQTGSHDLATVNSDVPCRADRCRSSMRRLRYREALAPVMPHHLRPALAHAPAGQDRLAPLPRRTFSVSSAHGLGGRIIPRRVLAALFLRPRHLRVDARANHAGP